VVVVDDGSTDATGEVLRRWASAATSRIIVELPRSVGKVGALRAGADAVPDAELIAVCDADLLPRSDGWLRLAEAFADDRVAAVAAFLDPANHDRSIVSRYAAVEPGSISSSRRRPRTDSA
jgi:glycosyltransferase involved in cell wall biosynthesis